MGYFHLHAWWGGVDIDAGSGAYDSSARVHLGTNAVAPGIGVRRYSLVFVPTPPGSFTDDVRLMHFDFLNLTGGAPDDTWTDTDYANVFNGMEGWFAAIKSYVSDQYTLREMRVYRIGPGITPPNPPAKVYPVGIAGTSSSTELSPQSALSLTLKTAERKRWGRTYLPGLTSALLTTHGVASSSAVDAIGGALDTSFSALISDDFHPVVYSPTTQAANMVEQVQVDNLIDVIRSRRWRNATHKYISP
jgi:hypothetical protein